MIGTIPVTVFQSGHDEIHIVTNIGTHWGGGARQVLPCFEGGGGAQKVWDPRFSHFVEPPLPVINDQSLNRRRPGHKIHVDSL